jgi:Uma2 family endonuclease
MLAFETMVHVTYGVPRVAEGWEVSEETMPESAVQDKQATLLVLILEHWSAGKDVYIGRNLAVRWVEAFPRVGLDPDVCVLTPRPPTETLPSGSKELKSVRTWVPGHTSPRLAIEIVSTTHPTKDYRVVPEKYAASGTEELWIADPQLVGPSVGGGPYLLQVWRRRDGVFVREHAGEGPAYSEVLGAWAVMLPVIVGEGPAAPWQLRIAANEDGSGLWSTPTEAAEARIRDLEAQLAQRGRTRERTGP